MIIAKPTTLLATDVDVPQKIMERFELAKLIINNLEGVNMEADQVTAVKIANNAITEDKWDLEAITAAKITNATMTVAEIADKAVDLQNLGFALPLGGVYFYTGDGTAQRIMSNAEFRQDDPSSGVDFEPQFVFIVPLADERFCSVYFNGMTHAMRLADESKGESEVMIGISSGSVILGKDDNANGASGEWYAVWVVCCKKVEAPTLLVQYHTSAHGVAG